MKYKSKWILGLTVIMLIYTIIISVEILSEVEESAVNRFISGHWNLAWVFGPPIAFATVKEIWPTATCVLLVGSLLYWADKANELVLRCLRVCLACGVWINTRRARLGCQCQVRINAEEQH